MKALILDVSYNSSRKDICHTLQRNRDVALIYAFDSQIYIYDSVHDLESDINLDTDFFSNACAYYDMVISILSDIRQYSVSEIVISSPRIDDCSRFTTEIRFNNYIRHFNLYNKNLFPTAYGSNHSGCANQSLKSLEHRTKYKLSPEFIDRLDGGDFELTNDFAMTENHYKSKGIGKLLDWILDACALP